MGARRKQPAPSRASRRHGRLFGHVLRGAFDLQTARDLLQKLHHDLEALRREPTNTYRAFNFFVTAEHMKDWVYPGNANRGARERLETESLLLQVCSHLANGAKHFVADRPRHRSVADTGRTGGYWSGRYWAAGYWPRGYWAKDLRVHMACLGADRGVRRGGRVTPNRKRIPETDSRGTGHVLEGHSRSGRAE
jgi:hypothetical protein